MKMLRKLVISIIITIVGLMVATKVVPYMQTAYTVNAASIKINKTKKTIYEGNTYTLKVTGTKKKVKWSSSNKSVAKVNSKGKVTAKENGSTIITAKVGKKKLKCKVKVKLVQFNTNFYPIKKVAKLHYNCAKINTYKDFYYDFDGDGKTDKLTIRKIGMIIENYSPRIQFELNGKKFLDTGIDMYSAPEVYIVDLDKGDKKLNLVTYELGMDDINHYEIFTPKDNSLKKIGNIAEWNTKLKVNQKGKFVLGNTLVKDIAPQIYDEYYQVYSNKMTTKKLNMKKIKNIKFKTKTKMFYTKSMKNLKKIDWGLSFEEGLKKAKIFGKKWKSFRIFKYTKGNEVYVKLNNGQKGYIFSIDHFAS